jgi:predicted ester cyclase
MTASPEDIRSILNILHNAFDHRDLNMIARYFSDDVRFVRPEGEVLGRQAKIADEQSLFENFADSRVEVTTAVVDGDEAVEICTLHGVATSPLAAAGRKVALRYVVHYRFDCGLIVFQQVMFDRLDLMRQLGLAQ